VKGTRLHHKDLTITKDEQAILSTNAKREGKALGWERERE